MSKDERGSGTALVAVAVLLAIVVGLAMVAGVAGDGLRRRAAGAADLVALSAAASYDLGEDPCRTAADLAKANVAELESCRLSGDAFDFVVSVRVTVRAQRPWQWLPVGFTGEAHAGRLSA